MGDGSLILLSHESSTFGVQEQVAPKHFADVLMETTSATQNEVVASCEIFQPWPDCLGRYAPHGCQQIGVLPIVAQKGETVQQSPVVLQRGRPLDVYQVSTCQLADHFRGADGSIRRK